MTQPFEPVPLRPPGGYTALAWTRLANDALVANFVHRDGRIWAATISADDRHRGPQELAIYSSGCRVYCFTTIEFSSVFLQAAAVAFANLSPRNYLRLIDDREGTTTDPIAGDLVIVALQAVPALDSRTAIAAQRLGRRHGDSVRLFPVYDEVVEILAPVIAVGVVWQGHRDWNSPDERPSPFSRADLDRVAAIREHVIHRISEPPAPYVRRRILDLPDEK